MFRALQISLAAAVLLCASLPARSTEQPEGRMLPLRAVALVPSLYGAEWRSNSTADTEVDLRNPDSVRTVQAILTFYATDGSVQMRKSLTLGPGAITSVLASQLVPEPAGGGLSVSWNQPSVSLTGSITITDSRVGGAVRRDLIAGYSFDTQNSIVGSWYLPNPGIQSTLSLFNSSALAITVTMDTYSADQANKVSLGTIPAHGTKTFALRDIVQPNGAIAGPIVLHYSGAPHALLPAITEYLPGTNFVFVPQFTGAHDQPMPGSETLLYPDLQLASSDPANLASDTRIFALLTNVTAERLAPTGMAITADPTAHVSSAVPLIFPSVAPKSSQLVDITDQLVTSTNSAGPVSLAIGSSAGIRDLSVDVFTENTSRTVLQQQMGDLVRASISAPIYWNLPLHINATPALSQSGFSAPGESAIFVQGLHLGAYAIASNVDGSSNDSRVNLSDLLRGAAIDRFAQRFPSGARAGVLVPVSGSGPVLLSRECLSACTPPPPAVGSLNAEISPPASPDEGAGGSCPSTINVTRTTLSQTSSVGRPVNGTFNYSSVLSSGSGTYATYSTTTPSANPNPATIGNPQNPNYSPSQGALARLSASYTCSTYGTTSSPVTWTVPTFGTSCYYIALQSDFFTAKGTCKSNIYNGVTYRGTMTNPSGLPAGTYCEWFLEAVKIQGSGELSSGTKIAANSATNCPNCSFKVVTNWQTKSGASPAANQTIAIDHSKIKFNTAIELAISSSESYSYQAQDTGSAIKNYRIDIFGGVGVATCTGYNNPMLVGSCSPGTGFCPKWVSKP